MSKAVSVVIRRIFSSYVPDSMKEEATLGMRPILNATLNRLSIRIQYPKDGHIAKFLLHEYALDLNVLFFWSSL